MFLLIVVLFLVVFVVALSAVGAGFAYLKQKQKNQIRTMLKKAEETPVQRRGPDLLRDAGQDDFLSSLLSRFEFSAKIDQMLDQGASDSTAGKLLGSCLLTGAIAAVVAFKFSFGLPLTLLCPLAFAAAGCLPFFLMLRKRKKTFDKFEEQFPEALDFLSRSMRAGHGFSVALELLSSDSPEPLARSFRRVVNDISLGSSLDVALGKLINLVPLVDVRFFVSAVILQQETGGNLGEILTNLAIIIRERFRLKGTVKAVSAHGRITGMVLVLMPVAVVAFLMVMNPQYLGKMAHDPIGRMMIYGAIAGQVVGYFVIKKIIAIKV